MMREGNNGVSTLSMRGKDNGEWEQKKEADKRWRTGDDKGSLATADEFDMPADERGYHKMQPGVQLEDWVRGSMAIESFVIP